MAAHSGVIYTTIHRLFVLGATVVVQGVINFMQPKLVASAHHVAVDRCFVYEV